MRLLTSNPRSLAEGHEVPHWRCLWMLVGDQGHQILRMGGGPESNLSQLTFSQILPVPRARAA